MHKVLSLPISISILVSSTFVSVAPISSFPLELHNDLYTLCMCIVCVCVCVRACGCVGVGIYCALINQIAQLTACGT